MTITAIHRNGDACGRVAFYYDDEGAPETMIDAARVTLPDGSKPSEGETMRCGSCGADIGIAALDLLPGEWNARAK